MKNPTIFEEKRVRQARQLGAIVAIVNCSPVFQKKKEEKLIKRK